MVSKRSWDEFRNTGLLLIINQILHAFGWAIVIELDEKFTEIINCYPARVKFRGFSEDVTEASYKRIGEYLKKNANDIYEETLL